MSRASLPACFWQPSRPNRSRQRLRRNLWLVRRASLPASFGRLNVMWQRRLPKRQPGFFSRYSSRRRHRHRLPHHRCNHLLKRLLACFKLLRLLLPCPDPWERHHRRRPRNPASSPGCSRLPGPILPLAFLRLDPCPRDPLPPHRASRRRCLQTPTGPASLPVSFNPQCIPRRRATRGCRRHRCRRQMRPGRARRPASSRRCSAPGPARQVPCLPCLPCRRSAPAEHSAIPGPSLPVPRLAPSRFRDRPVNPHRNHPKRASSRE